MAFDCINSCLLKMQLHNPTQYSNVTSLKFDLLDVDFNLFIYFFFLLTGS